ncbi:MAG: beta-lactamase family protein, partial [bacterium]|nr:beta-lactamase family protein [bacterium]
LVALDNPAASYVPELAKVQVLDGFAGDGTAKFREPAHPPTVRHLLTHTSGFGDLFWSEPLKRLSSEKKLPAVDIGNGRRIATALLFDPGTQWYYGISTHWLGVLVERVSGQSLEDYFQEHIFKPLGMSDTSYNVPPSKQSRLVPLHRREASGAIKQNPATPVTPRKVFSGSGGLYSTGADYLRLLPMPLRSGELEGRRVLREESVALMISNQTGAISTQRMVTSNLAISNDFEMHPGTPSKFGLGFLINTVGVPGGRSARSLAWAGAANTYFWFDPAKKLGGVILMQLFPFYDAEAVRLYQQYERALYSALDR